MARVAILSDIHANLHAFRAVLREIAALGADALVVAGDIIGYAAHPRQCVELVQKLAAQAVFGNHEYYTNRIRQEGIASLEPGWQASPVYAGMVHAIQELSPEQMQWIRQLKWTQWIAPGAVIAHSTLHQPEKMHYLESEKDARPTLELMRNQGIELAFFGHTHRQEWFAHPDAPGQPERVDENRLHLTEGTICAVTAGSVGQPRGEDGDPRASWVLWDTGARMIEFRKTSYPVDLAVRAILKAGLPRESAGRLLGSGGTMLPESE